MGLGLGAVVASAWRVQVEDGPGWRTVAERQRQRRLHIEPKRGTIYDRNGSPLALSVDVPSVSADVVEMLRGSDGPADENARLRDAADRLAHALALDPSELYERLAPRHRFVWVKHRITAAEADVVRDLGDPKKQTHPVHGVTIEGEGHRYYPGRELAGALLGFVAPDGQGKDGIELALDTELRGTFGEVRGLRDRSGRLVFEGDSDERALQGDAVQLTIDEGVQHIAEHELNGALHTYETKGGSLVVVEPETGELLAMASSPGYNPNDYAGSDADARRDRAITDRFEPGSVMKPFMMTGALVAGVLQPTDSINCEHGVYEIGGVTIHDTHVNDWLTPTQILAKSSNIGALKIGLGLGESALYATYRRFGFGEPTGIPLPGEPAGVLRPRARPWYDAETASASFGQGITVTTLQLAMAMAAIANGGKLLEPILVKKVVDPSGRVVREASVHVRREAAPASATRTIAEMLTAVTEDGGTAVEASVPGFRVAGKTSTAQKVDPATGKYSSDKYTAVFVGFLPVDRPRLVIAVVLDEPDIGRYGGDLAGPVFRRVAEASMRYLGVPSSAASPTLAVTKPGPGGDRVARAKADAAPGSPTSPADGIRVPDATGMPAHEAVVNLTKLGLLPQVEGWGRVVRQDPSPGSVTSRGSAVKVVLEPPS